VVLAAVKQNGQALGSASDTLNNNKGIVLAAVKQDGEAFVYAPDAMRNDEEVVMAAVREYESVQTKKNFS